MSKSKKPKKRKSATHSYAKSIARTVEAYFKNPQVQKNFEAWKNSEEGKRILERSRRNEENSNNGVFA